MKRIDGSIDFPSDCPAPVIAMGNFDGVHIGHKQLLSQASSAARALNGTAVAYTFWPHPAAVLAAPHHPPLIQTLSQRLEAIAASEIDITVVEPFTADFAHMSAADFFNTVIVTRLHAKALIVGYDFTFGIRRQGTTDMLETLCQKHGIALSIIPAQFSEETLVSSTGIRRLIQQGKVAEASALLGRPYELRGTVVRGWGLGKSLGASTANITPENALIPGDGIYLTSTAVLDDRAPTPTFAPSITSIGNKPTFPGGSLTIETHVLDGTPDLAEKRLAVKFFDWMREQIAFDNPQTLREHIAQDLAEARRRHGLR